jgi:PAS domain-containing protein
MTKIETDFNSTTIPTAGIPNSYEGNSIDCMQDDVCVPRPGAYLGVPSASNLDNVACNALRNPDFDPLATSIPTIDVSLTATMPASPHHNASPPATENRAATWNRPSQGPFSLAAIDPADPADASTCPLLQRGESQGRRVSPTQPPPAAEPSIALPQPVGPLGKAPSPAYAPAPDPAAPAFTDLSRAEPPPSSSADRGDTLLRRAARHGWDFPDLRRLYTLGYSPDPVWRLLSSLPPSLCAAIRDAVADRAGGASPRAAAARGAAPAAPAAADRQQEAELVFSAVDERLRQAMEEDTDVGYLEVSYDPASQRRTHVFLNDRYAALRGASRPELLARFSAHAVDLPAPPPDFLAALLHGLLGRREADCTQYLRTDCAGRGALVVEHTRKRFDGRGRVVKVLPRPPHCATSCFPLSFSFGR